MISHLSLESSFQDLFREPAEQTTRADQQHPLSPDAVNELPRESFIKDRSPGYLIHPVMTSGARSRTVANALASVPGVRIPDDSRRDRRGATHGVGNSDGESVGLARLDERRWMAPIDRFG